MKDKIVMSVGQCNYDHSLITKLLQSLDLNCEKVDDIETAYDKLMKEKDRYILVLVNRKIDKDHSDGIELIKKIKGNEVLKEIPVMLVSNYPEYQKEAVQYGAEYGFGKAELNKNETKEKILHAIEKYQRALLSKS